MRLYLSSVLKSSRRNNSTHSVSESPGVIDCKDAVRLLGKQGSRACCLERVEEIDQSQLESRMCTAKFCVLVN